jgi:hypothetical protein
LIVRFIPSYCLWICCLLGITALFSCGTSLSPAEQPIARVYDRYLYAADLKGIVPEGTSSEDSAKLVLDFIDTWIKSNLLLQVASENLSGQLAEIDRQASEYRETLLIEAYLQEWSNQNLDSAIAIEEIQAFYDENLDQFKLSENVYRIDYVIAEPEKIEPDSIKIWFRNLKKYQDALDRYCSISCIDFKVDGGKWYSRDDLRRNFPGNEVDPASLEASDWIEIVHQDRISMIRVIERKAKGDQAPLPYCRTDISKRILNRRHRELIKETYRDLFIEGSKRNTFEIY